jgi:hypothetical protein
MLAAVSGELAYVMRTAGGGFVPACLQIRARETANEDFKLV